MNSIHPNKLDRLLANEVSSIAVDSFLSPSNIHTFLQYLRSHQEWKPVGKQPQFSDEINQVTENIMHLFRSQHMEISYGLNENEYLHNCQKYKKIWGEITTKCQFDPFLLLSKYIYETYKIKLEIAHKNNIKYCPCVVRDLSEEVLPHADFGPYDGKGWIIEQVDQQIAWNIYLTQPSGGGETIIYDYQWDDSVALTEGTYGIKNLDKPILTKLSVTPGKLILFNCRNFHSISKSNEERVAIGGLIGKTKDNKYIAWS